MGFIKHFRDDFEYAPWPIKEVDLSQECCKEMSMALKKSVMGTGDRGQYINFGDKAVLINYCPWCGSSKSTSTK